MFANNGYIFKDKSKRKVSYIKENLHRISYTSSDCYTCATVLCRVSFILPAPFASHIIRYFAKLFDEYDDRVRESRVRFEEGFSSRNI